MKTLSLKIKDIASVNSITQALFLNGYSVKTHAKFKEYPRETTIDYFWVEIYDNSTEKDGDE